MPEVDHEATGEFTAALPMATLADHAREASPPVISGVANPPHGRETE